MACLIFIYKFDQLSIFSHAEVQKDPFKEKIERNIICIHYFNYQLFCVIIHAPSNICIAGCFLSCLVIYTILSESKM